VLLAGNLRFQTGTHADAQPKASPAATAEIIGFPGDLPAGFAPSNDPSRIFGRPFARCKAERWNRVLIKHPDPGQSPEGHRMTLVKGVLREPLALCGGLSAGGEAWAGGSGRAFPVFQSESRCGWPFFSALKTLPRVGAAPASQQDLPQGCSTLLTERGSGAFRAM